MKPIAVDAYVLDTLMADLVGHDRQPSAFVAYLYLWRQSLAKGKVSMQVSLMDISSGTGLSKRTVQVALTRLKKRQLVSIDRHTPTAVPIYTVRRPWLLGTRRSAFGTRWG